MVSAVVLGIVVPSLGAAFTLKTLVMPGRVVESHASIEEDCESCHETNEVQSQAELCFGCHKAVRDDVAAGTGMHGRDPEVKGAACYGCHAEHEGRDADITSLDIAKFEHLHTDFSLAGAHRETACTGCHVLGTPYREAPKQCAGCHAGDDPHKGALGAACGNCHGETAWRQTKVDHDKTAFPLAGAHAGAACGSCHQDQRFAGTPTQCATCHRADDPHQGRNGPECGACHTPQAWLVPEFDHAAKTGFALRGAHRGITCESCHVQNLAAALPKTCAGCHRSDDPHEGKLGATCGDCHGADQWRKTSFDHAAKTDFALLGAHAALECTTCHTDGVETPLGRQCTSCHERDPHAGQLGARCESCHAQSAWAGPIRFDHGLIAFPLLGKHAELQCSACHATPEFHDAGSECGDCHAGGDPHGGRLGAECAACHNPTAWRAWTFDHALQTAFPLTGAHAKVACDSCHRRPIAAMGRQAADDCGQCHRHDDPHGGRFGASCGSCHTTESFDELRGR